MFFCSVFISVINLANNQVKAGQVGVIEAVTESMTTNSGNLGISRYGCAVISNVSNIGNNSSKVSLISLVTFLLLLRSS